MVLGRRAAESAAKHYQELTGKGTSFEVEGTLNDDMYVLILNLFPAEGSCLCRAGGVKIVSGSRRITLDNTLDERLKLLEESVR